MRSRSTRFTNDEIELPTLPPTSSSTASANLVNPITSPKPVVQTASAPNLAPKKDGFVDPPKYHFHGETLTLTFTRTLTLTLS